MIVRASENKEACARAGEQWMNVAEWDKKKNTREKE